MFGKKSNKASITVFFAMLLTVIASFLFALLEAARITGLQTKAEVVSDVAVESAFAEYQKEIYKNYGLLLLDGADASGNFSMENLQQQLEEMGTKNLHGTTAQVKDLYSMEMTGCEVERYLLATDDGGAAFRHLAAESARREAGAIVLEEFGDEIQQKEQLESQNGNVDTHLNNAENARQQAQQIDQKNQENSEEVENMNNNSATNTQQDVKNPIEQIKEWKTRGALSVVVRDESQLSKKAIAIENTLERRSNPCGNLAVITEVSDEVWFLKYLEIHMGSYRNPKENRVLDYELEYILSGKATDLENLEETAKSLIKIREVSNFAYLMGDLQKQTEATEVAAALTGWTLNPAIVTATKMGVLGAWAYIESVLDVRALLEGRRIAWIKTSAQWTTDLDGIENVMSGFVMSNDCENGWDYTKYLQFLLSLKNDRDINYRSMDMIEVNTNIIAQKDIQMESMIVGCEVAMHYEAQPLFWNYITVENSGLNFFEFEKKRKFTYS